MKLTLKQARRVEREIGAKIDGESFTPRRESFSIYEDMNDKINHIQKQLIDDMHRIKTLTGIRFAIRKAIETENEVSGLNVLINREAELKAMLKVLNSMIGNELTNDELAVALKRHEATRAAHEKGTPVQNRYGEPADETQLNATLLTSTLTSLREEVSKIQRELLQVTDQQAAHNVGRTVQLDDKAVKALETAGIIL